MVGVGGQRNRMPANPTGFNASANTFQTGAVDPYYLDNYGYGSNSGVFNTYSNYFGDQASPEHYYNWLQGSGLKQYNESGTGLDAVQSFLSQYHVPQQQQGGIPPIPQGIEGFMSVVNNPVSGLNQIYSSGGAQGLYDFLSTKPQHYGAFGLTLDQLGQALGIGGPQQGSGDPFLDFLMNQMGIAGIGQQAPAQEPQRPQGITQSWGSTPWGFNNSQQAQAPADPYQQILATLRGADPLLSSLLGMLQLQPQPPPPVSNQRYGGF